MSSKIKITNNFYFTADTDNYILLECGQHKKIDIKTKKPTGEIVDYEDVLGYYSSLEALIRGCRKIIIREKIVDDTLTTIDDILDYMNDINNKLDDILLKIKDY